MKWDTTADTVADCFRPLRTKGSMRTMRENPYWRKTLRNIQRFFSASKIENFIGQNLIFFLIFAQNIDCVYTLEPPRRAKIRKNRYTPVNPSFTI